MDVKAEGSAIYTKIISTCSSMPSYRLRRLEILPNKNPVRKTKKELKKKIKKTRSGERNKVLAQCKY